VVEIFLVVAFILKRKSVSSLTLIRLKRSQPKVKITNQLDKEGIDLSRMFVLCVTHPSDSGVNFVLLRFKRLVFTQSRDMSSSHL